MTDIASRTDIERLVDTFYDRIRADALLGPIFDDVARVDWPAHLPKMYSFWETVLFGTAGYKGNPLTAHLALAQQTPLTAREFDHWLLLFHQTVDDLFTGEMAREAKQRAGRIATIMQHHVSAHLMAMEA
ncbi:MAG: group III truncated hemoglobin, partial [Acidobacteria bacterium]|nr:group III truncated hemoglobin [Acidobacteriota bacterium]